MSEQPWEVIRRAAERIMALGWRATPGPWRWRQPPGSESMQLVHPQEFGGMPMHDANVLKSQTEHWPPKEADAAWIALLSPAIATPLADWLNDAADAAEAHRNGLGLEPVSDNPDEWMCANERYALALARALLEIPDEQS